MKQHNRPVDYPLPKPIERRPRNRVQPDMNYTAVFMACAIAVMVALTFLVVSDWLVSKNARSKATPTPEITIDKPES